MVQNYLKLNILTDFGGVFLKLVEGSSRTHSGEWQVAPSSA